jgi:prepilin-type N-terminal cleavage/methylation domain-containing protein
MKTSRPRSAFTLVEILVVLVIIAALAAIIFPVFARVRESVRRSVCVSNLHQIGIALSLYRADYDGIDPEKGMRLSHSQMGLPYAYGASVVNRVYIRSRDVRFCPSYVPDPEHPLGSSYWWGVYDSEYTDPSIDWEGAAAARGPDYPLVVCGSHNDPNIPRQLRRSTDILCYYVLRINNRIELKKTTVADEGGGPYWW